MIHIRTSVFLTCLIGAAYPAFAQSPAPQAPASRPARPPAPTRDPNTAGYVSAKELPDGTVPTAKQNGNFVVGPTHNPAAEMLAKEGVPQGQIFEFTMESTDSKIYPGITREPGTFAQPDPADPNKLMVNSHPRSLHSESGGVCPRINMLLALESFRLLVREQMARTRLCLLRWTILIARQASACFDDELAISIGNRRRRRSGQPARARIRHNGPARLRRVCRQPEVLALCREAIQRQTHQRSQRPSGYGLQFRRCGGHDHGMRYRLTDLYHRVISYSGTFVYQQWPYNADTPHGAWELHDTLIPNSPKKPLRIWMHRSVTGINLITRDNYHDWSCCQRKYG